MRSVLPRDVYAIQNDSIKFDNIILCGTRGWILPERDPLDMQDQKIVDRELIRLDMTLKQAVSQKQDGDEIICIMHLELYRYQVEVPYLLLLFSMIKIRLLA